MVVWKDSWTNSCSIRSFPFLSCKFWPLKHVVVCMSWKTMAMIIIIIIFDSNYKSESSVNISVSESKRIS